MGIRLPIVSHGKVTNVLFPGEITNILVAEATTVYMQTIYM